MLRALFVDDDPEMLASIRMRARRHRARWTIKAASGGEAALRLLESESFDVVLTDLSMPHVGGGEVLRQARGLRPSAIRMVLSGRADRWLAKDAFNAHQVFTKPAELDDVLARAETALQARSELSLSEIVNVTSGVGVPPSPRVFATLHAALVSPNYEIESVARIVEQDLGLTSRVLQLASSSALGPRRSVSSVRSAVVVLGQTALEHLVLLEEALAPSPRRGGVDLRAHAMLVGRIATALLPRSSDCFVAGVLHNLGHLICDEPDGPGGRHPLLGSYLAALWGFPPNVVTASREHHDPPGDATSLSAVVWAADHVARMGAAALTDGTFEERYGAAVAASWLDASAPFMGAMQIPRGPQESRAINEKRRY